MTVVWERTAATKAIIKFEGTTELYRFQSTSKRDFKRQLENFLNASGATLIREVRT